MPDPTPSRTILTPQSLDKVADAVLALTRELWVVRDRQILLEAALAQRGIAVADLIDGLTPHPALQATLDAERDRPIEAVAGALDGQR